MQAELDTLRPSDWGGWFKNTSIFSKLTVKISRIFCHSILLCFNSKFVVFLFCNTTEIYFSAASYLTFRHFLLWHQNYQWQHWSFLQYQVYGFQEEENFSTSLLYSLWKRPEVIIFVKVIEINGKRDYLLAKGHVRPAIFPVPQPQSWQVWLQINSNYIQEALKCIWNLIPSCKVFKPSHSTC